MPVRRRASAVRTVSTPLTTNWMVPLGTPPDEACGATVAVNVISWPLLEAVHDDEVETSVTVAGAAGGAVGE